MKNLLILLAFVPLISLGQIQLQSSFETALPTGWQGATNKNYSPFGLIEGSETWSFAISTTQKRSGNSSLKMELRPGDRPVPYTSYRTEITGTTKSTAKTYLANTYRYSSFIPSGSWLASSKEEIAFNQFHPHKTGSTSGSPSLAIEIKNDRYRLMVRYTTSDYTSGGAEIFWPNGNGTDLGPVIRDTWVDWVIYYDPSIANPTAGRIIIWRRTVGTDANYVQLIDYTGRCVHVGTDYPFWKFGIYKWNNPTSGAANTYRIAYIDMVAFGKATPTTALSLMSLDGAPPPPTNQAPVIPAIPNQTLTGGTTGATLTANPSDPDGDAMTYQWAKVSGPGTQVITNDKAKTATVSGLTTGQYVFRFTATDSKGVASSATTGVTVTALNNIPTVTAGNNRTLSVGQDTARLDGEATDVEDPDCCAIHVWSQVSGPTALFNPADWNPYITGLIPGSTYVFRLRVTDSGGATGEATVSVSTPSVNALPTVVPSPPLVVVRTGTTGTIGCITADSDGPKPTVVWTQTSGPNTAGITSPTSDTTGLTGLVIGTYNFSVVATDNKGGTAAALVIVVVNRPPTVTIDTTLVEFFSSTVVSVSANGTAADSDGTVASLLWQQVEGPPGAVFTPGNATSTTISNLSPGRYIVRLIATDNDGAEGYQDYEFTITSGFWYRLGRLSNTLLKH